MSQIWYQELSGEIDAKAVNTDRLPACISPRFAGVFMAILREIPKVYMEFWDYAETVGLMNPTTHRAVYLMRDRPRQVAAMEDLPRHGKVYLTRAALRYVATMEDVPRLLEYLTMSNPRWDERECVKTAIVTASGVSYPDDEPDMSPAAMSVSDWAPRDEGAR